MNNKFLNAADAAWLMMETEDTPLHVGVLAIFQKPRNAPDDFISDLAEQLANSKKIAAPWNSRLASRGRPALLQRLVTDRGMELDYHFRHSALPAPGGEKELGRMVSRLHSNGLDLERPLWEFHLIEGLERNRFAFYLKMHHTLVKDVNAVPLFIAHLAKNMRKRVVSPLWSRPIPVRAGSLNNFDLGSLLSMGKVGAGLLRSVFTRGEPGSFALPVGTPRSTLNRHINHQRRFATQQISRARIERLTEATDSSVDELLIYFYGSVLRRFFKEYNALPDESLVGIMPLSLSEHSGKDSGTAITGMRVALGTHVANPMKRLVSVKRSIAKMRADREAMPEEAMLPYVMLSSMFLYASQTPGLGRFVPPLFNLGVSYTAASEEARYFNGAHLEAIYPMSPLMQYNALRIDCVSYADTLNFGFTGGRDTLPHLQRLAVYFGKVVEELEAIVAESEGCAA